MVSRREALQRATMLLGFAVCGSTAAAVMSGCSADPTPGWAPRFFTPRQLATLRAMLDHLLPKTSTPGALDVMADRFIDTLLKDFASAEERAAFLAGLADVDLRARQIAGKPFVDLPAADKDALFRAYEAASAPVPPNVWGGQITESVAPLPFYRQFKSLALVGYFASEQIGEHVLTYDPIPGRFDGCIPTSAVGKAWSL